MTAFRQRAEESDSSPHSEVAGAVKRLPGQATRESDASPGRLAFTIPCRV